VYEAVFELLYVTGDCDDGVFETRNVDTPAGQLKFDPPMSTSVGITPDGWAAGGMSPDAPVAGITTARATAAIARTPQMSIHAALGCLR